MDGSGWVRPVAKTADGTLIEKHYTLSDGTEAAPLDVLQIGLSQERPAVHQPENWVIDGKPWQLIDRPMGKKLIDVLADAVILRPELFRGFTDRVPYSSLEKQAAESSLALVAPEQLDLFSQSNVKGNPQVRGRFSLGYGRKTSQYNLVVTDIHWTNTVINQGRRTVRQSDDRFLLTISLSEPFNGECYKLIAAIILLPKAIAAKL